VKSTRSTVAPRRLGHSGRAYPCPRGVLSLLGAIRAVRRAARVVRGFEERDRILTAVTDLQIAEPRIYFLYGVATALVMLEATPDVGRRQKTQGSC
jgi:hypothetical protein